MSRLRRLFAGRPRPTDDPDAVRVDDDTILDDLFVCSTCGRADLPEAGGWDPPICLECDAAINFDALEGDVGRDG